ncbi:MAG: hypothetical protein ACYDH9_22440 [Limisphaerales bacterium]
MDAGDTPKLNDGQLFPERGRGLTVEPVKPKRPPRTVKEIEALVVGLQVALVTELNATKEEILHAIREGQAAVEAIAREMVRSLDKPGDSQDRNCLH